jgi:Rrf2 family nitric oxide-sensitive transcriptional repressor
MVFVQLTKFTDNALRVLIFTAANDGRLTTISEIAEKCAISRNHLTKVVHAMSTRGLLLTARGKGGGVRMVRPASEITVASVVRIMEGELKIIECHEPHCPLANMCRLKMALDEGRNAFLQTLENYTIADLIDNAGPLKSAGWM